jgi:tRNA dimethylallyltransferase
MPPSRQDIPAIVGPTACGKTELVLRLAQRFPIEVVSCDSRKVFRGADIGAAKPTADEQARVRFHMMDLVEPDAAYSVQEYVQAALPVISDIRSRGRIPLIEGGSGLYFEALMRGYDFRHTPPLPALRALMSEAWKSDKEEFNARLLSVFPEYGTRVDVHNLPRVVRYVEKMLITELAENDAMRALNSLSMGSAASEIMRARCKSSGGKTLPPMPVHGFALFVDRNALTARIEQRTEMMLRSGLIEEVQALLALGVSPDAQVFTGIGYRETLMFLQAKIARAELAPLVSLRTRQFAKRQDTWNRNRFAAFTRLEYTTAQEKESADAEVATWLHANWA